MELKSEAEQHASYLPVVGEAEDGQGEGEWVWGQPGPTSYHAPKASSQAAAADMAAGDCLRGTRCSRGGSCVSVSLSPTGGVTEDGVEIALTGAGAAGVTGGAGARDSSRALLRVSGEPGGAGTRGCCCGGPGENVTRGCCVM